MMVLYYNGKYSWNSKKTNYSHGSLHSLFKEIFRKSKLYWNEIYEVIILGFGTGSISEIIGKYKH
jgi:hypothetical protein